MEVDWTFLLIFSFLTIIGILIGGLISKYISNKSLKKGFGLFTLFMAFYIIFI
jgi:uncharacterized membrane protein YfcA